MAETNPSSSGSAPDPNTDVNLSERDIQFDCSHCANILVVDRDGAGMSLKCPFCGGPVVVPNESEARYHSGSEALKEQEAPGGEGGDEAASHPQVPHEQAHEQAHQRGQAEHPPAEKRESVAAVSQPSGDSRPPEAAYDFAGLSKEVLIKRQTELAGHLKENRSQRVEMQGHINKATIELHRFQIKMKTLAERHHKFESEFKALQAHLGDMNDPG